MATKFATWTGHNTSAELYSCTTVNTTLKLLSTSLATTPNFHNVEVQQPQPPLQVTWNKEYLTITLMYTIEFLLTCK